jgi:hypothetical protein
MSIHLRDKPLKSGGKSLYLDIYHNGVRTYEFLKIYLRKGDDSKTKKEKRELAEAIRAKRLIEIQNDEYGFTPSFKKNIDFIAYFQSYIDNYAGKGIRKYVGSLKKFKKYYSKKSLPIKAINFKICKGFCEYLKDPKNGLSGSSSALCDALLWNLD